MDLPLAKGEYVRNDNTPTQLTNMLYETDPTNIKDQVSLISRAGYDTWSTIGTSGIRMMQYQRFSASPGLGPYIYLVTNEDNFYKVDDTGTANQIGGNGTAPYRFMTSSRTQLLLSGGELAYSDGATLTPISRAFMDGSDTGMSWTFGGYALVIQAGSERFYWSAPGEFQTWDALSFAAAESQPDGLSFIFSLGDYLYPGGSKAIEVWSLSTDPDAPFVRVRGRVFGCGISGGLAIFENEIAFFVGGTGGVWRLTGEVQKISPEWVDGIVNPSVIASAYTYSYDGHAVYILNGTLPTGEQWSLVFDAGTNQWSVFKSHNSDRFEPNGVVLLDGRRPMLSSPITGKIYEQKTSAVEDNGNPIVREFTGLLATDASVRIDNVILDCSVGAGTETYNPQIELRWSDDRGNRWTTWVAKSLGLIGRYRERVLWTRLGVARRPSRLFHWRYAGRTGFTARRASFNEDLH